MTEGETKEFSYKILLLGDSTVGKTCFLKRFTDGTFQDAYLSTIGYDFKFKNLTLKNGKEVRIQVWDTAGQERFRTISRAYYKGAHGVILMYDVTNQKTFNNIKRWLEEIKKEASNRICLLLIANKIDMKEERIVSIEDGENLAKDNDLQIIEASAKEDINVSEAFQKIAEDIVIKNSDISKNNIKLQKSNQESKNAKKGCCK